VMRLGLKGYIQKQWTPIFARALALAMELPSDIKFEVRVLSANHLKSSNPIQISWSGTPADTGFITPVEGLTSLTLSLQCFREWRTFPSSLYYQQRFYW
jgi:hypothetical protein